jgi:hypothetical protein
MFIVSSLDTWEHYTFHFYVYQEEISAAVVEDKMGGFERRAGGKRLDT